jgi:hypothetical protein
MPSSDHHHLVNTAYAHERPSRAIRGVLKRAYCG